MDTSPIIHTFKAEIYIQGQGTPTEKTIRQLVDIITGESIFFAIIPCAIVFDVGGGQASRQKTVQALLLGVKTLDEAFGAFQKTAEAELEKFKIEVESELQRVALMRKMPPLPPFRGPGGDGKIRRMR